MPANLTGVLEENSREGAPLGIQGSEARNHAQRVELPPEGLGLYYDHARFYDPTLGRFVSADPVLGRLSNPQSLDRYVYSVDSPLRYLDPSGLYYGSGGCGWWEPGCLQANGWSTLWAFVQAVFEVGTAAFTNGCFQAAVAGTGCNLGRDITPSQRRAIQNGLQQTWLPVGPGDVFVPGPFIPDPGDWNTIPTAPGTPSPGEPLPTPGTEPEPIPGTPSGTVGGMPNGGEAGGPEIPPGAAAPRSYIDFAPGGQQAALEGRPLDVPEQSWLQGVKDVANEQEGTFGTYTDQFPNLLTPGVQKYGYVWGDFGTLYSIAINVEEVGIVNAYVTAVTRIPMYGP